MSYSELVKSNADETDIRSYLTGGKQVAVTFRIPENLRESAKEAAELRGMSFSAWMSSRRRCSSMAALTEETTKLRYITLARSRRECWCRSRNALLV